MKETENLLAKQYINSKKIENTPVFVLNQSHSDAIVQHFMELSSENKRMRFGYPVSFHSLQQYVSKINFEDGECLGFLDDDNQIRGVSHVSRGQKEYVAELGLSVNEEYQGKGIGFALLIYSAHWAKHKGYDFFNIECLAHNTKITNWVKRAGFPIQRIGFETLAVFPTIAGPLPQVL